MIKIYHNPRCTKSRQGIATLEAAKVDFEIIKYLDSPLKETELKEILSQLNISPLQLVRKPEKIWKENYRGKELSDDVIIMAMLENPKLIERPIVVKGNKAVIGRPTELIVDLIKN
ncbi:arsenate reductase (glutaredoxin) [Flavicella sp.]|uniref:arsenate reductase (glutaredoxin) n=1 Tax=Flavicella sp. TaxID=2957742 RepID=UPI003018F1D2